jgi:hypothetical protein
MPVAGTVSVTRTVYDARALEAPKPIEHVGTDVVSVTQAAAATPSVSAVKTQRVGKSASVVMVNQHDPFHTMAIESMLAASAAPVDAMKAMGLNVESLAAQIASTFQAQDDLLDTGRPVSVVAPAMAEAALASNIAEVPRDPVCASETVKAAAVAAETFPLDSACATTCMDSPPLSDVVSQFGPVVASRSVKPVADLGLFLDPVVGDPLLVDVSAMLSLQAQQS